MSSGVHQINSGVRGIKLEVRRIESKVLPIESEVLPIDWENPESTSNLAYFFRESLFFFGFLRKRHLLRQFSSSLQTHGLWASTKLFIYFLEGGLINLA